MKTLFTNYLTFHQPNPNGDWWGAAAITNESGSQQTCEITVREFFTGKVLKKETLILGPYESIQLDRSHPIFTGIVGKTRLYIDCPDVVTASAGMSRGTVAGLNMIPMQELPFPKS